MNIRININLKLNRVVKYFILADLCIVGGWGLIAPIFSVFVVQHVVGATLATVGTTAAVYWILRSALQLPIARYMDRVPGERDDFNVMIAGLLISAFAAFSFILVSKVWHLYVVEIFHGIGFALYTAAWSGIFSRHVDREHMAFDWSLDNTTVGLAVGVSGFLGGIVGDFLGFNAIFLLAGLCSMVAAIILLITPELILPGKVTTQEPFIKDHTPMSIGK